MLISRRLDTSTPNTCSRNRRGMHTRSTLRILSTFSDFLQHHCHLSLFFVSHIPPLEIC